MRTLQSNLDLAILAQIVRDWPTHTDAGNVDMVYDQSTPVDKVTDPYVRKAIEEIELLTQQQALYVMVNTLKANRGSPIHTDTLVRKADRYHLPLQTNKDAVWWDTSFPAGQFYHMSAGFWHGPVPYHEEHQVINAGDTARIHLIVDLEPRS